MKYTATLSPVQVGQAVKALVLLGEKKITIEDKLYSIINIDHDRTAKEMYLYLEEERTIK